MSIDWTASDATVGAALRARGVESDLADAALKAFATAAVEAIAARNVGITYYAASTYDPEAPSARYDGVVIDLVKLVLEFSGLDSRRDGDYAEESAGARSGGKSYQEMREEIISELIPPGITFA